jgi:hypothetical protein
VQVGDDGHVRRHPRGRLVERRQVVQVQDGRALAPASRRAWLQARDVMLEDGVGQRGHDPVRSAPGGPRRTGAAAARRAADRPSRARRSCPGDGPRSRRRRPARRPDGPGRRGCRTRSPRPSRRPEARARGCGRRAPSLRGGRRAGPSGPGDVKRS